MSNITGTAGLAGFPVGTICIFGLITVIPTPGVGVVNGTVTPLFSTPIPITQVVGPAGGPLSLNQVNGRFALVCGTLVTVGGQCKLQVTLVVPVGPFGPLGGSGTGTGV